MTKTSKKIIGVDFDNTIVSYDELMYHLARQQGWINPTTKKSKKIIRDLIRLLPDGEIKWQQLQAMAYGSQMSNAGLIAGVKQFFQACKQQGIKTYIVSHKTEYANYDETKTNLREAALNWMNQNQFFQREGLGLSSHQVYFETTRKDKIERLKTLQCQTHIDDLEETFQESYFPSEVQKILYDPHSQHSPITGVKIVNSWREINEYFFGTN